MTLDMDLTEAERLGAALLEGPLTLSRAGFFIRTGVAAESARSVADTLLDAKDLTTAPVEVPLPAGDEATENPAALARNATLRPEPQPPLRCANATCARRTPMRRWVR
ncbi:hypothetical protein AB0F91_30575 [Amycolatopsis sp. NPDC023774]|uniref:hypothetical protein n=1 Tax=Amycolatopsis sp. NPDC023774 TaxID=3155015 RepID=UPI0034037566